MVMLAIVGVDSDNFMWGWFSSRPAPFPVVNFLKNLAVFLIPKHLNNKIINMIIFLIFRFFINEKRKL